MNSKLNSLLTNSKKEIQYLINKSISKVLSNLLITSRSLRLYDLLGDEKPIVNSISEYKVIREILWMLQSPSYSYLFQRTSDDNIFLRKNVSIPSLTDVSYKIIKI